MNSLSKAADIIVFYHGKYGTDKSMRLRNGLFAIFLLLSLECDSWRWKAALASDSHGTMCVIQLQYHSITRTYGKRTQHRGHKPWSMPELLVIIQTVNIWWLSARFCYWMVYYTWRLFHVRRDHAVVFPFSSTLFLLCIPEHVHLAFGAICDPCMFYYIPSYECTGHKKRWNSYKVSFNSSKEEYQAVCGVRNARTHIAYTIFLLLVCSHSFYTFPMEALVFSIHRFTLHLIIKTIPFWQRRQWRHGHHWE